MVKCWLYFNRVYKGVKMGFRLKARKYNYETKQYDDYTLPDGACLVDDDLDKNISCAACGSKVILGDCYTSLEIHTDMGFGFCVCHKCYKQEIERRAKYENAKF